MTHGFEIVLLALTVWGEARGEGYTGKLAVAYVICNRMRRQNVNISKVVLKAWQFSFFNTDDPSRDKLSDINPNSPVWIDCLKAATSAYFELQDDPTNGAEFYMNIPVVRKQRNGTLPVWWDKDTDAKSQIVIGQHTFRCRKAKD